MTAPLSTPEWIRLDGTVNARVVAPGALLRSANLQSLSARDIARLKREYGLEVVIDLRTDVELALEGAGPLTGDREVRIEHRSLYPDTGGNTDLDAETVSPWGRHDDGEFPDETPVVRAYLSYLRRRPDSVAASIRTIARTGGSVLVHCAAGKDRTGVVIALALDAAGVQRELIVADYLTSRQRIEEIVAHLVRSPTYRDELSAHDPQRHAPLPGTMERFLQIVDEQLGGSVDWLLGHGLERSDLERLRLRLLPASAAAA